MRWHLLPLAAVAALALAACGDKPQEQGTKQVGAPAWQGTDNGYAAPGWKAGDETSWETQMRNRAQGQNEYSRTSGAS
jgi:hypothetical protein